MSDQEFAGSRFSRGILVYLGPEILPFKIADHQFYALPVALFGGAI